MLPFTQAEHVETYNQCVDALTAPPYNLTQPDAEQYLMTITDRNPRTLLNLAGSILAGLWNLRQARSRGSRNADLNGKPGGLIDPDSYRIPRHRTGGRGRD